MERKSFGFLSFCSFVLPGGLTSLRSAIASLRSSFPWSPRHREHKHCLKCDWLRYARLSLRRLGNNKTRWLCCAHCKNKERWLSIKLEVTSLLFLDSTSNTLFVIALALLVIPAGFEPTTHSLEGCCSIQLSYGTIDIAYLTVAKCSAKVIKNWQFTIHSPKIL